MADRSRGSWGLHLAHLRLWELRKGHFKVLETGCTEGVEPVHYLLQRDMQRRDRQSMRLSAGWEPGVGVGCRGGQLRLVAGSQLDLQVWTHAHTPSPTQADPRHVGGWCQSPGRHLSKWETHPQGHEKGPRPTAQELCSGPAQCLALAAVCMHYPRILLKCRFEFSGFGVGPEILHS